MFVADSHDAKYLSMQCNMRYIIVFVTQEWEKYTVPHVGNPYSVPYSHQADKLWNIQQHWDYSLL